MDKLFAFAENTRLSIALLVLLGALMFMPGLFTIPPIDRDEARFAQASKQMIETNHYLDIRYQDDVRYKKPVGIYWLQVASTKIFGAPPYNQIWTYRIPSLLAAIAALVLTYLIGRTLMSAPVGFGAALLMACSLILAAEARLAKTDATLLALTLMAVWQLAQWYKNPSSRQKPGSRFLFWMAVAVGILVKGPVILLVVGGIILAWLCLDPVFRRDDALKTFKPLLGIGIVAVCVAPWLIAITIKSNGLFWAESVGHDMLGKVKAGQESHGLPFGTHTALLFALFLPALVPLVRGIVYAWKTRTEQATQFLLAWILPAWLIFEIIPTKLPHYTLPMIPAIAILAAAAISKSNFSARRVRLAFAIPLAIALALNVKLLGFVAPRLPDVWIAPQLQTVIQNRSAILVGYAEPSAVFLLGTRTKLIADAAGGLAELKNNPKSIAAVTDKMVADFQAAAKKQRIKLLQIGRISGFNLGRGKKQDLFVFEVK